ncbi:MAG: galactokinase family protein [Actinomyces urogenitalis]|uniref:galactokinase family protein n=1 Tax=Actinomyces urogenitalis TaxID=103621 RepID=UPI002A7FFDCD|nr:galactokinase family protein [Actinomyces urogenitalis]MDY3678944.1 galactokinase family protein [Actinomyces urogenitalis]
MSTLSTRGAWRVPGRIEFLGKHTDYAGGNVLVGAVDRGVSAVAKQVDGAAGFLSATTTAGGDPVRLQAGVDHGLPAGHWGRYLQTVLDRLTANFGPSVPAHLTITSDLPPASGMSSSSALICASALALADLNGWSTTELWKRNIPDRLSLAGYLAGVEAGRPWRELLGAEGVGTQGGSEDHTGMLCGEAATLLLARFAPMEIRERVAFPEDWAIVVGVSGVLAEKTGAALADYNRGPLTLRSVLARWNKSTGRQDAFLASAVASLIGEATGEEAAGSPELRRLLDLTEPGYERGRVEQFLIESLVLVPAGAQAVAAGDAGAVGEVLARSHALADSRLLNQVPATNAMVSLARDLGAIGASAFGAGWGGSVYAVVPAPGAEDFAAAWLERYQREAGGPASATTIVTRPGASASRLG